MTTWTADFMLGVDSILWTADGFVPTSPLMPPLRFELDAFERFSSSRDNRVAVGDRSTVYRPKVAQ